LIEEFQKQLQLQKEIKPVIKETIFLSKAREGGEIFKIIFDEDFICYEIQKRL